MYIYKKRLLIILFTVIDAVGRLLSWPFKVFSRKAPSKVSRIAVLRLDHIGDVIMAAAVLKPLKKAHPSASIDLLVPTWAFDIVRSSPDVSQVTLFDAPWFDRAWQAGFLRCLSGVFDLARVLRQGRYDAIIDLRGDFRHIFAMWLSGAKKRISYGVTGGGFLLTDEAVYRKGAHQTELNMVLARVIGAEGPAVIELHVQPEAEKRAEKLLQLEGVNSSYAVIHADPGHYAKVWDAGSFFTVASHVSGDKDMVCLFVGTGCENSIIRQVVPHLGGKARDISGKTDLAMLLAIIRKASFFVGVDSAPAHIAAAFKVPGVVLFSGVNDPVEWAPRSESLRVLCPGKGKDLSSLTPKEVCEAIDGVLGQKLDSVKRKA